MITNITTQSFADFTKIVEEKAVVRQQIDTLASYYTDRVSANETTLIEQYAAKLVSGGQPHTPDPRMYMRQNLLSLVQDSYALGINDGYKALEDVQFSYKKTVVDFALDPNDKLQRDINKLQNDIQQSQQVVRQAKTLNQYTKTLQALQQQAQTLDNTQATQTLTGLSQQLQSLKTGNTVKSVGKLINQQLQKGGTQQQQAQNTVTQQIAIQGQPNTQDYLIKRAIEEKLNYLQNRKDALTNTPPIVLEEDKDFFRWYAQKRIVPIANRYQMQLEDRNNEAKQIVTEYTEKIGAGTINQTAKGTYTDKVVRKILNIEDESEDKYIKRAQQNAKLTGIYVDPFKQEPLRTRPIKRVQRVVATELAIAYNVGRLKTYLKAGIQYVTISTSMYSNKPCSYCVDTEEKSLQKPIKISSLLKNAYRNDGFKNKTAYKGERNVPIEQRYLVSHPYCMCIYMPSSKTDDIQEPESQGVYTDPNAWKFILGSGLGVSLVFLAFALTTGKKIQIPTTIPPIVPILKLPSVRINNAPITVPIDTALPVISSIARINPNRRQPISFRSIFNDILDFLTTSDIPEEQQASFIERMFERSRNNMDNVENLLYIQSELGDITSPEIAKRVVDKIAEKRGLKKKLYFSRFDKVASRFNKTVSAQGNIDKLRNRVQQVLSKVDGETIIRTANNIEKTSLDSQLASIYPLRLDLAYSLKRVLAKVDKKESDLSYIKGMENRTRDLDNFTAILQRQKRQLDNIRSSVVIVDKAMLMQQISNTQSVVDRLASNSSLLQEAQDHYQDLIEMLLTLPQKEAIKYNAIRNELNRRIKSAQGITLKRFTDAIVEFRYTNFDLL